MCLQVPFRGPSDLKTEATWLLSLELRPELLGGLPAALVLQSMEKDWEIGSISNPNLKQLYESDPQREIVVCMLLCCCVCLWYAFAGVCGGRGG